MNVGLKPLGHQDLKVTSTIERSMDIEPLNVDQSLCGYEINQKRPKAMDITSEFLEVSMNSCLFWFVW